MEHFGIAVALVLLFPVPALADDEARSSALETASRADETATKDGTPPAAAPAKTEKECGHEEEDDDEQEETACERESKRRRFHFRRYIERTSIFGVRASLTNIDGSEHDGSSIGVSVVHNSEHYKTHGVWTTHGSSNLALGGGGAGLEGALGGALTFGVRIPTGDRHGPVARIGFGGELMGNGQFYFSRLALPIGEFGYQFIQHRTVLEVGARGGWLLSGRYNSGNSTRRELGGSGEWGAYVAAHTQYFRADVSYSRISGDHYPGGDIDVLRGWLCGHVVDRVAICADAMFVDGAAAYPMVSTLTNPVVRPIPGGQPTTVRSVYGGITLGVLPL